MSDTTYVYVIARKEGDKFTSPVKIGMARDPLKRLGQFQTAAPFALGIFACFATPAREDARFLEQGFHHIHSDKQAHGEWFDIEPTSAFKLLGEGMASLLLFNGYPEEDLQPLFDRNRAICARFNKEMPCAILAK